MDRWEGEPAWAKATDVARAGGAGQRVLGATGRQWGQELAQKGQEQTWGECQDDSQKNGLKESVSKWFKGIESKQTAFSLGGRKNREYKPVRMMDFWWFQLSPLFWGA